MTVRYTTAAPNDFYRSLGLYWVLRAQPVQEQQVRARAEPPELRDVVAGVPPSDDDDSCGSPAVGELNVCSRHPAIIEPAFESGQLGSDSGKRPVPAVTDAGRCSSARGQARFQRHRPLLYSTHRYRFPVFAAYP